MTFLTMHPGHDLTVTPVGPAFELECTCGHRGRRASRHSANRAALLHHHDAGGCTCPPDVVAHPSHPQAS